ncbi:class I SAM-dependent methyltransferase [Leptolyngbyaceae cyanobacterium CCMR0082]|uniref:Class I SAM-dependent methyltransferase n=1 Tax=Adonisia turfae CCMR0082 TaxID=2304604 RepID=A0A6M0SAQ8_9CYAN|nr:class I SAM-dependent methyltransferase [Adonisia turfae]NEZ65163.1 class I SAM-dependent methyltransferase [Adonisia turfae CCMR0082]
MTTAVLNPIDRIREINRQHFHHSVWSYFSTPPALIRQLLRYANLQDGMHVLEPSAGKGAIAQRIYELWNCTIHCVEKNPDFNELLQLKGFQVIGRDFGILKPQSLYDRVIANPPFDRQMKHLPLMYQWLKPGGKLVSIANANFLNADNHVFKNPKYANQYSRAGLYHHFFQWLEDSKASIMHLPKGSFAQASRTTQVDTVMIMASKPLNN